MDVHVRYERKVSDGDYGNEGFSISVSASSEAGTGSTEVDLEDFAWEIGGKLRDIVQGLLHESQSPAVREAVETEEQRKLRKHMQQLVNEARAVGRGLREAREQVLFAEAKLRQPGSSDEARRAEWAASLPGWVEERRALEERFKAAVVALREAGVDDDAVDAVVAAAQPAADYDYDAAAALEESAF